MRTQAFASLGEVPFISAIHQLCIPFLWGLNVETRKKFSATIWQRSEFTVPLECKALSVSDKCWLLLSASAFRKIHRRVRLNKLLQPNRSCIVRFKHLSKHLDSLVSGNAYSEWRKYAIRTENLTNRWSGSIADPKRMEIRWRIGDLNVQNP